MMLAAQNGHSDVVEMLLQYEAYVDIQNVVRITIITSMKNIFKQCRGI